MLRRLDQLPRVVVGADGLVGMVVAEDEHDVRGLSISRLSLGPSVLAS